MGRGGSWVWVLGSGVGDGAGAVSGRVRGERGDTGERVGLAGGRGYFLESRETGKGPDLGPRTRAEARASAGLIQLRDFESR